MITLIIFYRNTHIGIESQLFLTKTANWVSIVLKMFLVYVYDIIIAQHVKVQNLTCKFYCRF